MKSERCLTYNMVFLTADTANKVYELASKDFIFEEVLRKYFPNKKIREEFTNEIWLYLLEHPDRTVQVWNQRYFKYYFIGMVKNQVLSNSSSWHLNFRKTQYQLPEIMPEQSCDYDAFKKEENQIDQMVKLKKIELINNAISHYLKINPHFKPSADIFILYYFEGLSIRQISESFFSTPPTTIWEHLKEAEVLVKFYIRKYHPKINWDDLI